MSILRNMKIVFVMSLFLSFIISSCDDGDERLFIINNYEKRILLLSEIEFQNVPWVITAPVFAEPDKIENYHLFQMSWGWLLDEQNTIDFYIIDANSMDKKDYDFIIKNGIPDSLILEKRTYTYEDLVKENWLIFYPDSTKNELINPNI